MSHATPEQTAPDRNEPNRNEFDQYIDGVMSAEDAAAFEARLEGDEDLLTAFLEYQEETDEVVAALDVVEPPPDLDKAVRSRIRRRSRGRFFTERTRPHQRFHLELFVGVSAVILLAVFLFASPERWQLWNAEFEELPTSTTPSDDEELPFDGLQDEEGSGDGDTIPPDAAIDNELNDSTRGEPEADAPTDPDHIGVVREAREGATSGMPTANVALQGFQYTVTVDLNEDDLGARVRRQFLERVETDADGRLIVWFERDEFEQGLLRLSELGTVERERVGLDPSELRVGVVVQSASAD